MADEYLKIAFHGLRAKDKTGSPGVRPSDRFNVELKTDFSSDFGPVEVVPQELGRVLLNLYNNAFYAVKEKQKTAPPDYQPTLTISTRLIPDPEGVTSIAQSNGLGTGMNGTPRVEIRVHDNGTGISESVKAKIFQPFFTTKPTGEGTGLGLSLSYDIITKGHGGELRVDSVPGQFTEFIVTIPTNGRV